MQKNIIFSAYSVISAMNYFTGYPEDVCPNRHYQEKPYHLINGNAYKYDYIKKILII
jgi:hypothetical protein